LVPRADTSLSLKGPSCCHILLFFVLFLLTLTPF
jgi:hypothetical protein